MEAPKPNPTADEITRQVLEHLKQHGFTAWRQPNEGRYDPSTGKWYPHPNARRGVPDIIGFRNRDGVFIGVEVKTENDQLRDEQVQFLNELRAAHGLAFVAYSFDQFRFLFERRGLHLPSAEPGNTTKDDAPRATPTPTDTTTCTTGSFDDWKRRTY